MDTDQSCVSPIATFRDLAMFIRRLVVRLRHSRPDQKHLVCDQAMEYLRKTGLANPTDILRSNALLESEVDEALMRENLLKCYGSAFHGFRVSTDHYRYLAEQIVSLREATKR